MVAMLGRRPRWLHAFLVVQLAGCAYTAPYVGQGPHPQIERGRPNVVLDTLGNVLAVIPKILLLDWRFANHTISPDTESYLVRYFEARQSVVGQTHAQLNEYAPHHDLSHLVHNRNVAWPYRATIGLLTTVVIDVILPGRVFPWGDYYNPWTNTMHLYSDDPPITLHEAGHAYDINKRHYKGTYAILYIVPFFDLFFEMQASREAIHYLKEAQDHDMEARAYKVLYPAYGTYVGHYLLPPIGTVAGVVAGHVIGRSQAAIQQHHYRKLQKNQPAAASQTPASVGQPQADATASQDPAAPPAPESSVAEPASTGSSQP